MNRPMARRPSSDANVNWAKALAVIVVLVIIGVFVLSKSGKPTKTGVATSHTTHSTSTIPTSTVPPSTTTTTLLPVSQVKLQVLNGVLTGSLAGQWTAKLKSNPGYTTEPADNATARVAASIIYVLTPGYQPEARALATTVGLSVTAVDTTVPPPSTAPIPASERTTANLVLVIGPDLASSA